MNLPIITTVLKINLNMFLSTIGLLIIMLSPSIVKAESDVYEETVSAVNRTYYRFCSVCHGKDARGNGPYSENLKLTPPDLTKLTYSNDGSFPWIKVYQVIDGKNISVAHGSSEMPVWGELFDLSNWDKGYTEHSKVIVRGRIFELLVYLDFIQEDQ